MFTTFNTTAGHRQSRDFPPIRQKFLFEFAVASTFQNQMLSMEEVLHMFSSLNFIRHEYFQISIRPYFYLECSIVQGLCELLFEVATHVSTGFQTRNKLGFHASLMLCVFMDTVGRQQQTFNKNLTLLRFFDFRTSRAHKTWANAINSTITRQRFERLIQQRVCLFDWDKPFFEGNESTFITQIRPVQHTLDFIIFEPSWILPPSGYNSIITLS